MDRKPSVERLSRRGFLGRLSAAVAAILAAGGTPPANARPPTRSEHPEPRPGIDASNVLTAEELADAPDAIPIYDGIREIPHIADGIRCYCGCAELPGYRSLLTCFEANGMAKFCEGCQGQARLAYRRWKEGQSLDQIRRATDARFAPSGDS